MFLVFFFLYFAVGLVLTAVLTELWGPPPDDFHAGFVIVAWPLLLLTFALDVPIELAGELYRRLIGGKS